MKTPAETIRRVGIIGNRDKAAGFGTIKEAARLVTAAGRELVGDAVTADLAGLDGLASGVMHGAGELARSVDLLLVFGGDGTILRVAREIAGSRTPLLGINIGSLGFLTAVPSDQVERALGQVWRGEFTFEPRVLLHATGRCGAGAVDVSALNDIVVSRGIVSRLIELEVRVEGDLLTRYRCDGLIVSSPTGSTAYSLAAGGPVIWPTAAVLALTPINPHTLSNRALILPLTATVEITVAGSPAPSILSADGEVVAELAAGDVVTVRRGRRAVRLLRLEGSSFCQTLRHKLHWRGGTI